MSNRNVAASHVRFGNVHFRDRRDLSRNGRRERALRGFPFRAAMRAFARVASRDAPEKNTHRGPRTHDHKFKSLAPYRLS